MKVRQMFSKKKLSPTNEISYEKRRANIGVAIFVILAVILYTSTKQSILYMSDELWIIYSLCFMSYLALADQMSEMGETVKRLNSINMKMDYLENQFKEVQKNGTDGKPNEQVSDPNGREDTELKERTEKKEEPTRTDDQRLQGSDIGIAEKDKAFGRVP